MTDLPIDDDVIAALRIIAEREGQSAEQLANSLLRRFLLSQPSDVMATTPPNSATKDPFLLIAQAALKLGLSSEEGDIAERSRDILAQSYADHLMEHRDYQEDDKPGE